MSAQDVVPATVDERVTALWAHDISRLLLFFAQRRNGQIGINPLGTYPEPDDLLQANYWAGDIVTAEDDLDFTAEFPRMLIDMKTRVEQLLGRELDIPEIVYADPARYIGMCRMNDTLRKRLLGFGQVDEFVPSMDVVEAERKLVVPTRYLINARDASGTYNPHIPAWNRTSLEYALAKHLLPIGFLQARGEWGSAYAQVRKAAGESVATTTTLYLHQLLVMGLEELMKEKPEMGPLIVDEKCMSVWGYPMNAQNYAALHEVRKDGYGFGALCLMDLVRYDGGEVDVQIFAEFPNARDRAATLQRLVEVEYHEEV